MKKNWVVILAVLAISIWFITEKIIAARTTGAMQIKNQAEEIINNLGEEYSDSGLMLAANMLGYRLYAYSRPDLICMTQVFRPLNGNVLRIQYNNEIVFSWKSGDTFLKKIMGGEIETYKQGEWTNIVKTTHDNLKSGFYDEGKKFGLNIYF